MNTAFYSVIQFCPDAARHEAVNVGVVLFDTKTGYVGVKFTQTLDRIQKFFGKGILDAGRLKVMGESVQLLAKREKELFKSPDSFRTLIERQTNEMRFTQPRKIALGHPQNVLEGVYLRLVEGPQRRTPGNRLESKLRREFDTPEFTRRVRRSVEVTVDHYPQPIRAPFGYQNGVFNLIQPATFQADDASDLLRRTGGFHLEGELLRETTHPDYGPLGLVVVGQVKGAKRREAEQFISERLAQEEVTFYSIERLGELLDDIRRNAKLIVPPTASGATDLLNGSN